MPTIEHVSAAAIVTSAELPAAVAALVDTSQKFVVHPHLAKIAPNNPLLVGYLRRIYSAGRPPLATQYPTAAPFPDLQDHAGVANATQRLAEALAATMGRKNAKAGILFGFALRLDGGNKAHGVIKADLDDEQRFHFKVADDASWDLGQVSDILPPPRSDFAKYAIAPQPGGREPTGIRDTTDNEAAAAYFLEAIGLRVPKETGVQAAVAGVALNAGYNHREIQAKLSTITEPVPVEEFVRNEFPRVSAQQAVRLRGSDVRPAETVRPDDTYIRVYKTRHPRFELAVDPSVQVSINGRVITVTLPPDSEDIQEHARP